MLQVTECNFMRGSIRSMGLFSVPFVDETTAQFLGCVGYGDSVQFDAAFLASRAFAVMAILYCGVAVSLLSIVLACKPPNKSGLLWKLVSMALCASSISQILVFVALGSDVCGLESGCTIAPVGSLGVFNVLLQISLCAALFRLPLPMVQWFAWWKPEPQEDELESAGRDNDDRHIASDSSRGNKPSVSSSDGQSSISEGSLTDSDRCTVSNESMVRTGGIQEKLPFRLATVLLITVAWAIMMTSVRRCTFLIVNHVDESPPTKGMGLFSQAIHREGSFLGCVAYTNASVSEFNASFKTARAFGAFGVLLMTCSFFLIILQLFHKKLVKRAWRALRWFLPTATLCQLVMFSTFGMNECQSTGCQPGATGSVAILNLFLMTSLCCLFHVVPSPAHPVFKRFNANALSRLCPAGSGTKECRYSMEEKGGEIVHGAPDDDACMLSTTVRLEYTATEKKITKTITHADGTTLVSTTIEELKDDTSVSFCDDSTIVSTFST